MSEANGAARGADPAGRCAWAMVAKKRARKKSAKKRKAKKKSPFPRVTWTRSPVQRPHSTKKGGKGYDRRRRKREDKGEIDEGT